MRGPNTENWSKALPAGLLFNQQPQDVSMINLVNMEPSRNYRTITLMYPRTFVFILMERVGVHILVIC